MRSAVARTSTFIPPTSPEPGAANGDVWSAEFLPKGGSAIACVGLVATAWRGHASKRLVRAAFVLLFALSMFVPCFYVTFLWNRLRYLWPFAPGWFIGLACLGRACGDLFARVDRRVAPAVATLFAGACAVGDLSNRC